MKKKVILEFEDGNSLEFRGYSKDEDEYFVKKYKKAIGLKRITRQYYPLKKNDKVIIYEV